MWHSSPSDGKQGLESQATGPWLTVHSLRLGGLYLSFPLRHHYARFDEGLSTAFPF